MLQLKRLEIQGFKSFADRTELRFQGTGFTSIVGPNGCGKSNLADAISWVLGEQSAKSLRGSRMEDVIFAGTRDRKSVGMASVTMTLFDPNPTPDPIIDTLAHPADAAAEQNTAAAAAAAAAASDTPTEQPTNTNTNGQAIHTATPGRPKPREITITRRLYRSGESEYLINGRHARLRDIQDLFMGTGLGPESYAIIEQGRITQILSTKPMERRSVIEEAAGVSKFKTRRRLAEAKLEGAKQNLSRVFDILEEVGRQVNSLKRQAAKAKRYEELKTEMLGHLRRALAGRYKVREREAAKAALDLNEANREFQTLTAALAEKETLQAGLQEQCFALEHELTTQRSELAEQRVEAERAKGRLQSQSAQIENIDKRLTAGQAENTQSAERLAAMEADFQSHAERLAECNTQYDQLREKLTLKTHDRDQKQHELRQREQALEAGRQQVLKLLGETSSLKNQLAQVGEYLSGLDRENARARREEEAATTDIDRIATLKHELSQKIGARQLELTTIVGQRRGVEEELQTRKSRAVDTRRQLDTLRGELSRLKARKDSTQDILSHRTYTTESVKRLFTAVEKGKTTQVAPLGVLADYLEVDPAWEKATEEFLHEELEYVVVRDWAEAHRGVDLMRSDLDGRATFLVHPEPGMNIPTSVHVQEPAIGPETGIVARLSTQLKMTNGLTKAPTELIPRLARCLLVEDREAAQRLALQYPDFYFLLPDGVSYHGHAVSGGKKTGSGPLALKRELRELTTAHNRKQAEADKTSKLLADLEQEIAHLTEDLERLRAVQQLQEKDALALEHESRKLNEEHNRTNQRLSVVRLELQRLATDGEKARDRKGVIETNLENAEVRRTEQETALEAGRNALTELQQLTAQLGEEHGALRVELAGLEERRRAEQSARARLDNQIRELANRRQHLAAELQRLTTDRARLSADNGEIEARLQTLHTRIGQLEASVRLLEEQELQARGALAQAEESLRQLRTNNTAAQERRTQLEVHLVKLQSELQFLDETCRKELNTTLEELALAEGESDILPDEAALAECEAKYQEVRTKIDNLGPVNPQAMEEFQEAQQRHDFLSAQRQDLLDSIRDTEKAIHDIDVESRKRFNEAFEAINANFKETYKVLFNGGVGEMRLTDPDNHMESGIDIMASPPGKKLQNVLLLSGGERSLTAMALLLAIFRYTPSPFCVLDEVDAALDEANTTRLVKLLKDMSEQTQFVIITHAKRTMEASEAMYGVTMQEPGVSKIVSVRFGTHILTPQPRMQMAVGAD